MSMIAEILTASRARLEERRARRPLADVRSAAADAPRARAPFRAELERVPFSLIAEIKRRSPSMGSMDPKNVERALDVYAATPAVSAISILTNEGHFGSSLSDLESARKRTDKPLLRKDFIVDEYQVWEARAAGADALLLMAGVLPDPDVARDLFDLATSLEMAVLFEVGMGERSIQDQVRIIPPTAPIWGINSRNFRSTKLQVRARLGRLIGRDFWTSPGRHHDLMKFVPAGKVVVAESGIHDPSDLRDLRNLGYRGALIGTAFLKEGAQVEKVVSAFALEVAQLSSGSPDLVGARATA